MKNGLILLALFAVIVLLLWVISRLTGSELLEKSFQEQWERYTRTEKMNANKFWIIVSTKGLEVVMIADTVEVSDELINCIGVEGKVRISVDEFQVIASGDYIEEFKHDRIKYLHDQISEKLKEADELERLRYD